MTSDPPDPDSWDQAIAAARRRIENCRQSIVNAAQAEAAAPDPTVARWFRRYAAEKRLEMVTAALELCDLQDRQVPHIHWPADHELREHERRLGLPEGTFWRGMREPWAADAIPPRRGLELAKELAEAELRTDDPPKLDPDYAPAIIRICCATMVGALVGAPLGALAIHESVLKKMAEAAIVTGLGAIAAEIAGPLSELARPHKPLAELATDPRTSIIDRAIDELLHPDRTTGDDLPDLNDDPDREPSPLPDSPSPVAPPDSPPPVAPDSPSPPAAPPDSPPSPVAPPDSPPPPVAPPDSPPPPVAPPDSPPPLVTPPDSPPPWFRELDDL